MKGRIVFVCLLLGFAAATFGQGQITFQNRFVQTPEGTMYHVPIWIDLNGDGALEVGEGVGSYAATLGQKATLALYLQGALEPLATAYFRSDTNGQFLGNPVAQDVLIPGYPAGTTAPLTIKAWIGPDYETATVRGAWDFTSLPLGGTPSNGGPPMIPPTVFGWGNPNGEGYQLTRVRRGQITFQNRLVQTPDGPMYDVPIWIDLNGDGTFEAGEGIGSYAAAFGQTATLGLYLQGGLRPLATALFRSDTNGQFLGNPALQDVFIPGYPAGTTAPLTIKAWIGPDYETAAIRGGWDFTSLPLGGLPPDGSVPMIPPSVAGWGDLNGHGYNLTAPIAPIAGNDVVTRRSFGDARISIAALLANDSDPAGGSVSFVGVDSVSSDGAALTRVDGDIVYYPAKVAPDFFFYTVRNSAGGMSKGRVDVTIVDPDGIIVFSNRYIGLANGSSDTYDVPIFVDANFDGRANAGEGMGTFASAIYHQPAKLGLFLRGSDVALATATFRVDSLGSFVSLGQAVIVPGVPPGARADLTVKAWIGNDFSTAKVKGAWDFTSARLGGFIAGGTAFGNPGMTGWGNENGSGYGLAPGAKLIVGADEVVRPYRQDVMTSIATLLANDSDPDGGTLTVTAVDSVSNGGATVTLSGTTITYNPKTEADDYFTYTVRSTSGATAVGRVNVKASEPIGEIYFSNFNIPKAVGGGTYNVPIYVDYNTNGVFDTGEDLGTFAAIFGKTATMALYQQGSNQPIATVNLRNGGMGGGIGWVGRVGVGPTGTVPPAPTLTSINVNVTNPDSGIGFASYSVKLSGGLAGTFVITNGSEGNGTYTYTVDNSRNTARLVMNYGGQFAGDYDDMTLIFSNQPGGPANNFSGAQLVGGHQYWLNGNFTYIGLSDSGGVVTFPSGTGILVPGFRPGEHALLTIKAWVGNDFDSATIKGSWDFTSLPLGGPLVGTNVPVPGLTGWGNENGEGYALQGGGEIPIVRPDPIHIFQGTPISVITLLPTDPSVGGQVAVIRAGPMTDGGNQVVLYNNNWIYFPNYSFVGTDSFSYAVLTSAGAVGAARVNVTIDPCTDCSGTTGPPGDTSTGTSTGTGTGTTGTGGTGTSTGGGVFGGKIVVVNQLVRHAGGGAYNVPIWVDANFNGVRDKGEGIGAFASSIFGKTATLGMFVRNAATPFATVQFKTNVGGAFLQEPGYTEVAVPGFSAGSPADLTIKAWVGDDYASATLKGSWDFTSLPLGFSGNDAPDITGWGVETAGKGYAIIPGVKPRVYGQVITRLVGQNVNTMKAAIMQNDSDPGGGALTFVSVDEFSKQGAVITVLGNTVYYVARNQDNDTPDYFEYTVRNPQGGYAKGRVDVVVTDAQGQFNTLLEINYTPQGNDISFRGVIGSNYTVQFRDTVDAPWQDLGPAVHDAFGLFKIVDPNGTNTRFYRVVTQP